MSVTFNERKALEEYIAYIREERSRLLDEYKSALSRLSKLDEIDNLVPEPPKEEEPELSLEEVINQLNRKHGVDQKTEEEPKFTKEVEKLKDYDEKKKGRKRSSYRDVQKIAHEVVSMLKEAGRPMKTQEIIDELKKRGFSITSPYGLLNQVRGYEPKIEKASFGYYQYKW